MTEPSPPLTRRDLFRAGVAGMALPLSITADPREKAVVAITLDLEMSRNYPTRDQTHWDFEKGNLDRDTKRYALDAARRVKKRGGVIHFFAVGRVLEQEDVGWLSEISEAGHPVGNHTYDHVNVKATRPEQVQFRFQRAPWLIEGKTPREVIIENIAMTTRALKQRVGITADGFRTPGGFSEGLKDRPDVQRMLLGQGFRWVSSLYPPHPIGRPGEPPTEGVFEAVVKAQPLARPFTYPSGLIEVPMNPISDVSALRAGGWTLEAFLKALSLGVGWAIERGATFDFLAHPSCLVVADPNFRAIDLVCDLVDRSKGRAELTGLGRFAARAAAAG